MKRRPRQASCNGVTYHVIPAPGGRWDIFVSPGSSHRDHGQLVHNVKLLRTAETVIRVHAGGDKVTFTFLAD